MWWLTVFNFIAVITIQVLLGLGYEIEGIEPDEESLLDIWSTTEPNFQEETTINPQELEKNPNETDIELSETDHELEVSIEDLSKDID